MVKEKIHSRSEIMQLLSAICDPEIPVVSIEEMGILRDVLLHDNECEVIITPTYTGCPAMGIIEHDIVALLQENGILNPKVTLCYAPSWTTDWMTENTKRKLGDYGIASPLHSSCSNWMNPVAQQIPCPRCNSLNTKVISQFGSTACKALYSCNDCKEPFDYFKCH
jgi:ring-1,2-phenylacetyl-CoA epoxidase subunit PaaD